MCTHYKSIRIQKGDEKNSFALSGLVVGEKGLLFCVLKCGALLGIGSTNANRIREVHWLTSYVVLMQS